MMTYFRIQSYGLCQGFNLCQIIIIKWHNTLNPGAPQYPHPPPFGHNGHRDLDVGNINEEVRFVLSDWDIVLDIHV